MANNDANYDGVVAGTAGGVCAGQLSTDTTQADYAPLLPVMTATATAVDALVGTSAPPPPSAFQVELLDQLAFGWWLGRNPVSGTIEQDEAEIQASLSDGLVQGIYHAFQAGVAANPVGNVGNNSILLNASMAGSMGGMLAGTINSVNNGGNASTYAYVADEALAVATAFDRDIATIGGGATVYQANLASELCFAWFDGRNPTAATENAFGVSVDGGQIAAIVEVWTLGSAAISAATPTSAIVWNAAFAGGLGGMCSGQLSNDYTSADWAYMINAAVAFAYAVDTVLPTVLSDGISAVKYADTLRQICHAWMRNRNPPNSVAAQTTANYEDVAGGIVGYFAEIYLNGVLL
jgi:hypothetical protein